MTAYCMKCRAQRDVLNPVPVILKNGRNAVQGTCTVCTGKISRMGTSTD